MERGQRSLEEIARKIRINIVRMVHAAGSGHMGGPLGMADIYAALYFQVLNHRSQEPLWDNRDRLILSCGHTCPVRYAAMAEAGYFPEEELLSFRKFGSRLQGHPSRVDFPALETSSGPLGQGLSQAIGMALEARRQQATWHTYCIMSDGEHQEGQIWEAILLAGARKIYTLTAILDRNYIQIDGPTEEILPLDPMAAKYQAAGWHVIEINGHDTAQFIAACEEAQAQTSMPTCIIAYTTPGKGVDFMESDYLWHGKAPNAEEAEKAIAELEVHV
jgi:transketolase